jgi:hypothetical protein
MTAISTTSQMGPLVCRPSSPVATSVAAEAWAAAAVPKARPERMAFPTVSSNGTA